MNNLLIAERMFNEALLQAYRMDETTCIHERLQAAELSQEVLTRIETTAQRLVNQVRRQRLQKSTLDSFLHEYDLSTEEGIALMCLAEALLRVPDDATVYRLIRDKVKPADWQKHLGKSRSFFVNAATWGLMLTGKIMTSPDEKKQTLATTLQKFLERSSQPVIDQAVRQAMKILGQQFVLGKDIKEALEVAAVQEKKGYSYSFDMLGEAAHTESDAKKYFQAYQEAIAAIHPKALGKTWQQAPGISVKLSALHPRYELAQATTLFPILIARVRELALQAQAANINLTIDAEEADRLYLSLVVFETIFKDPIFKNWAGFGLAVQAYQKRAYPLIIWLIDLAHQQKKRIPLRLVKGAYWDYEIKESQVKGLKSYPVFTRKVATDVSYIACIQKILSAPEAIYPQFATHNAYSVATVLELAGKQHDFEFQCLHGMGAALYDPLLEQEKIACRIYAPIGVHQDLLPYLVRRLLENGANTSFVNRIMDEKVPLAELTQSPVKKLQQLVGKLNPRIPLPIDLFMPQRKNSMGLDVSDPVILAEIEKNIMTHFQETFYFEHKNSARTIKTVINPANPREKIGHYEIATPEDIQKILQNADSVVESWDRTPVKQRADYLRKAANLFEEKMFYLMSLIIAEGGRTFIDAMNEVRETVDYCRYYALQAEQQLTPKTLSGPTGEFNQLQQHGRGITVCISPWNFPLAIFTGQVVAALVAGNPVIAKPAELTPFIARKAIEILHQAGIPEKVLQFLPAPGSLLGQTLLTDARIANVMLTGSTETARMINRTLAERNAPLAAFVAETGGQNCMIVDSTALPEQVVTDAITSAFNSAGQRCSGLRVLYLQEEVADKIITMLKGAMAELTVGDPHWLSTDVGPVISATAKQQLEAHIHYLEKQKATLIAKVELSAECEQGHFFSPYAFEIPTIKILPGEVFGPILHVIRYRQENLDDILTDIRNTGFGLTLGIHSRINETVEYIQKHLSVGNTYVNRNMIGAVVGVQPFGGEGLSGTGPKAGGPHYLTRLCVERTLTINTTAAGGNATLMAAGE